MSIITPTITTDDAHEYREQMELIATYSAGVHLDFSDGVFAPTNLLPLSKAWRSDRLVTHAHIMYREPMSELKHIKKLNADLVILHVESDEIRKCLELLQENGNRTGIALLPETSVDSIKELGVEGLFDYILIFGGHLGFQGGEADLSLLKKLETLRAGYPDVEIAWDGGVNDKTAKQISEAGADVLNVGSYLKNSKDPKKAYDTLSSLVS